MLDDSASFARYLEDLLTGEGYWDDELVILPKNLVVAMLSLLQHLLEERPIMPASLLGPAINLNNALGAALTEQGGNS